jgi:hypothetical protein
VSLLQFDLVATQLSYASSMDWEWKDRLGDLAGCGAVVDGLAACCCNSRIMLMLVPFRSRLNQTRLRH